MLAGLKSPCVNTDCFVVGGSKAFRNLIYESLANFDIENLKSSNPATVSIALSLR